MKAKAYLNQIEKLDVLINNKLEQCAILRGRAISITSNSEGERVQTSPTGDKLEQCVIKIIDLERELEADIEKLKESKREVMSIIDKLENAHEIDLLYKRYIRYEKWDKIADEMHYSIQGIFKLHGIALLKIQKILDEKVKSGVK